MSPSLDIRVAAVRAFDRYFGATQCSLGGNLESDFRAAFNWLEENGKRLRREALNNPNY